MRNLIESNPDVMMGKPVVAGTRITVEMILEKLGAGETTEQILTAHPRLTPEAIQAGQEVFDTNCFMCHSNDLSGGIGPSFLDDEWVHGNGDAQDLDAGARRGAGG